MSSVLRPSSRSTDPLRNGGERDVGASPLAFGKYSLPSTAVRKDGTDLRAAVLAASLLLLSALVGRAQELTLAPERITIPSGDVRIGSHDPELDAAVALCRSESRLDGGAACTLERFALELAPERHHVAAFLLDRTEVTRGDYLRCVTRGLCAPAHDERIRTEPEDPRLPITGVDLSRAETYCRARGGRLPTELEWARAAHGDGERTFPWGEAIDAGRANHGRPPALSDDADGFLGLAPVGSFASGANAWGVLDLGGNVWEWTTSTPREEDLTLLGPITPAGYRVVRGGSYLSPLHDVRAAARNVVAIETASRDLGFRCVYEP
jgi:formylglycine-generating enzyme required for sulfatase activity